MNSKSFFLKWSSDVSLRFLKCMNFRIFPQQITWLQCREIRATINEDSVLHDIFYIAIIVIEKLRSWDKMS